MPAASIQRSIAAFTQSGNGDSPDMAAFPNEVDDGPVTIALLQMRKVQV
jgi:hypothetical protein